MEVGETIGRSGGSGQARLLPDNPPGRSRECPCNASRGH